MGLVAPPSKCPACGTGVPWGRDVGDGVHRYECLSCNHKFEVRAIAPGNAPAPGPAPGPTPGPAPAPAPFAAPVNPYAASPQPAANTVMCGQCGKVNQARYQFCLGCGADLSASQARAAQPNRERVRRGKRGLVGGILGFNAVFWALFTMMFVSPKACALFSPGNEDLAIETLKKCPRAREKLGDGIGPAWVGCTSGKSAGDCNNELAHWSTTVAGSKGRGDYDWDADEHDGKWTLKGGWLHIGGEDIDIVKCTAHGDGKSEHVEIEDDGD
jgi:hypothetical protein